MISDTLDTTALAVFIFFFALVPVIGFVASRWRQPTNSEHLDEWGLGGRQFGTWITWFLVGGDFYTAYTLIALPALVYAVGAYGFFALPYTIIVYPIVFAVMPIVAANLFTRNFWKAYVNPDVTDAGEAKVAKITSMLVKVGALLLILLLPTQFALNLQLLGGLWILQTFPAVVYGALKRGFSRWHAAMLSLRATERRYFTMASTKGGFDPTLIGVVIYDGVEPIDVGATMGVVSMAQRVLPAVRAVTIAAAAGPVALAGGLTVMAEFGFANAPDCDVVVVCGGPGWTQQVTDAGMLGFLQQLHSSRIASVCTGAMILSAAGMLDGLLATTRRRAVGEESAAPLDRIASFGHGVQPRASLVVDAGVVTGGGVSLAIDTMLYLLGRLYGAEARDTVAEVIEYDRAWAANRAALGIAVVAPT